MSSVSDKNNNSNMISSRIISKFRNQLPSIWVTINKIVAAENPINLGQGFPDYISNKHVTNILAEVAQAGNTCHQYTRAGGHARLVRALARLYSPCLNRSINHEEEILVSVGAYGSLYFSINAIIEQGDEAVIIEPFFDCYKPMVELAGGIARFVPLQPSKDSLQNPNTMLHSSDLVLDETELRSLINKKTKLIILNTPNNPNGKVMSMKELEMIASICKEFDLICISDEVYEWLVYPPYKHLKIASLPGMWERTITIGSIGKTLSVTGWKLGWSVGPPELIRGLQMVSQNCVYNCATPIQEAAARCLEQEMDLLGTPDSYFSNLCLELVNKRDRMVTELIKLGMKPIIPDGGYFILADFSDMVSETFRDEAKTEGVALDEYFNNWIIKNMKVAAIPNSCFYSKEHRNISENFIRFCFFKTDETLELAFKAFRDWKSKHGSNKI